jgi:hypothetical protein
MERLTNELVVLCEGDADKQFLRKLSKLRPGMPKYDLPFPTDKLHGNSSFDGMLTALSGAGVEFDKIRGVLIVADSASKPSQMFDDIQDQVRKAGFPVPAHVDEVAIGSKAYPSIEITLLPRSDLAGCLETLLIEEIAARRRDALDCAREFLKCGTIDAHTWESEKRDKALFGCLVAALNRDDPSRAASKVFKDPKPFIDVTAACFDHVAKRLIEFSNLARRA